MRHDRELVALCRKPCLNDANFKTLPLNPFPTVCGFFFWLYILKGMADCVYFPAIAFGVTIFQEFAVATMEIVGSSCVLDRTPELLRSPCYLANVGEQSVKIAAVDAVYFLNAVEIT
jgi:hypothetical protein